MRAAPSEHAFAFLGAGPIEDLLRVAHEDVFNDIEAGARQNAKFRSAIRFAWFEAHLPADQTVRFRQFGPPLSRRGLPIRALRCRHVAPSCIPACACAPPNRTSAIAGRVPNVRRGQGLVRLNADRSRCTSVVRRDQNVT